MAKNLLPSQTILIKSLLNTEAKTSQILRAIGSVRPGQAIESDLLFNYPERESFEVKYIQLLRDSEMILGTSTKAIDIIALRFLEHWKYEPMLVLLKFIDELTKGAFRKVHKNVLDLPTLNSFFIEFKGPYIEALELRNRAKDKSEEIEIDYEKHKENRKNEKSQKYKQAKKFSDYLGQRGNKDILHARGIIKDISGKPLENKGNENSIPGPAGDGE